MIRKTAKDFDPQVLQLFDKYVHGDLSRRGFLQSAGKVAAGALSAEALLAALSPNFAQAQQVAPTDPRIVGSRVAFPSPDGNGKVHGYLVRPAAAQGKPGAVLVVHENRGLNPHIEDIARRVALAGHVAFAPDALHPLGGYPGDEDKARALFPKLDQAKTREDFVAAAGALKTLPGTNGSVGVVGFCYGGGIANLLATRLPDLAAAVPFYGAAPAPADVPRIRAQVLVHHAGNDARLLEAWPGYEAALKSAGIRHEGYVYPGVEHGFNNDTTPRYDDAAAKLAWQRTLALFDRTLRA
ncbi:carboxymethylenebutenolidase [Massilia sp. JS1662]|nr:dienelactone hydrolase family protein [Massilia sp. JS1662]KGF79582.1 carboxymethylenebutenolidase [Massilia sp. JS1662]